MLFSTSISSNYVTTATFTLTTSLLQVANGTFFGLGCCFSCIWGKRRRIKWCNISQSNWLTNRPTNKPTSEHPSGTKSSNLIFQQESKRGECTESFALAQNGTKLYAVAHYIYIASEEIWLAPFYPLNFCLSDRGNKTKGAICFDCTITIVISEVMQQMKTFQECVVRR